MSREVEVLRADRTRCDMFGWRITTVKMILECGHRVVKVLMGGKPEIHSGDMIECQECEQQAPFAHYYSEEFKDTMRKLFPGEKERVQ